MWSRRHRFRRGSSPSTNLVELQEETGCEKDQLECIDQAQIEAGVVRMVAARNATQKAVVCALPARRRILD